MISQTQSSIGDAVRVVATPRGPVPRRPAIRINVIRLLRYAAASLVLVLPCFWLPRIAAGDLASHIYNVWLVQLIRQGKAPGLSIAHQSTNVLFDYALEWLTAKVGFESAQKIAMAAAVLLFFWSALGLITVMTKRRLFYITPLIAILAYGTVFNQGLMNYYLSGALSVAALGLAWNDHLRLGKLWAVPIVVLAWLAQPLPVLVGIGIFAYVLIARKFAPAYQPVLFFAAIVALLPLRWWLVKVGSITGWSPAMHATGLDQSYMLGHHYRLVTFPLLAMAFWLACRAILRGRQYLYTLVPLHIYVLCLAACVVLPHTLSFPWYAAKFGAVPERVGWLAGVFFCVFLVQSDPPRWFRWGLGALAVVYFTLLFSDATAMNRIEDRASKILKGLPEDQRVIASLNYPLQTGLDVSSIIDRACIERCISFGNYEAATLQFRVRATPGNSFVAWTTAQPVESQYFLSQPGGVLYKVSQCGTQAQDLCLTKMDGPLLAQ